MLRQLQRLKRQRFDTDVGGQGLRSLRTAARATGAGSVAVGRAVIALFQRRIDDAVAAAGERAVASAKSTGIASVAGSFVTRFPHLDAIVAADGNFQVRRKGRRGGKRHGFLRRNERGSR